MVQNKPPKGQLGVRLLWDWVWYGIWYGTKYGIWYGIELRKLQTSTSKIQDRGKTKHIEIRLVNTIMEKMFTKTQKGSSSHCLMGMVCNQC